MQWWEKANRRLLGEQGVDLPQVPYRVSSKVLWGVYISGLRLSLPGNFAALYFT